MKVPVFTWPSSLAKVKVKVASLNAKLDEKPKELPDLSGDTYDEIKDDLQQGNPFLDEDGNPYHDVPETQ